VSGGSFSRGLGEWIGAAEVYTADGRFAGMGRDTRRVQADDRAGRVTVEVSFQGPFSLSGSYTIADHGSHRSYEGPLNIGRAEVLGDGLVATHNYWPDLGLSQRFFLMVLPDGDHQLSLALLGRGDRLRWTVVGEYRRQAGAVAPPPPPVEPTDASAARGDPSAGRGQPLLLRPGRWSGRLALLDSDLRPAGSTDCVETFAPADRESAEPPGREAGGAGSAAEPAEPPGRATDGGPGPTAGELPGRAMAVEMSGLGFASDASFMLASDGWTAWTGHGDVAGSAALSGGRGLSGQFHHDGAGRRVWRREIAAADGSVKAVLHIWYRGEQRLGAAYGTMAFDPP
jgi:hypothetical protein